MRWMLAPVFAAATVAACGERVPLGEIREKSRSEDPKDASSTEDGKAAYQPCSGKTCGAGCTQCAPGDSSCFETAVPKRCNANGECSPLQPMCGGGDGGGYDPCAGKQCGARCTTCPPNEPSCVETAELKYCSKAGVCWGAQPDC